MLIKGFLFCVIIFQSQRGKGSCPKCSAVYLNRYKPEKCQSCGCHIGGHYQPQIKKQKIDVPQCVEFLNHETCRFFSSRTVRNLRCFFIIDGEQTQCHNEQCKLARAAFVNSNSSSSFTSPHIVKAEEAVQPLSTHTLTPDAISQYKADQSTKDRLIEVMNAVAFPHLYQLSESVFCAYGPPTSSNPIGFVHLTLANAKIDCSSKDCKGYGSVMRQEKKKKICIHCHTLLCFYSVATLMPATSSTTSGDVSAISNSPCLSTSHPMATATAPCATATTSSACNVSEISSVSRDSTIKLNMLNYLPYDIPANILDKITLNDSHSNNPQSAINGWPSSFSPEVDFCRLCGSQLSLPRPHPGQKAGPVSYILTNAVAFLPVEVFVKFCQEAGCKAMHQVFPFNVG